MITNGYEAFLLVFLVALPIAWFLAKLEEPKILRLIESERKIREQIIKDEIFFNSL